MPDRDNFDLAAVLARKQAGRMEKARMSFGEKIEAMEALRERLRPFRVQRDTRKVLSERG